MGKDLKGKELGTGISQRNDGRYMARFCDNRGMRHTYYGSNLKNLEKRLLKEKYEFTMGIYGTGEVITLNEWFIEFIKLYKEGKIKDTTIYKMRTYYNKLIVDDIGMMRLKDIKAMHVQNFINGLFEKGLAHSTVLNIKCLLGDMIKKAIANEYMLRNPCDSIVMPKKPRLDTRYLKVTEQSIFLEAARDYYHYDIFEFCLTTGMRIGEVLGIKWSDIDFENKIIRVNRTLHYSRKDDYELCHFFFTSPKTDGSIREVPLLEETERALKRCRKRQLANKIYFGKKWKEEVPFDNMVFTSKDGAPVRYGDVNRTIKTVIDKINLAEQQMAELENRDPILLENFSPHCFRHTYVTRCRENKVPLEVVQKVVGHSSEEMTLYYDHNEIKLDISSLKKISFLNVV